MVNQRIKIKISAMKLGATKKILIINLAIAAVFNSGMILGHPNSAFSILNIVQGGDSLSLGASVYKKSCSLCHRINGEGMSKVIPPLAKSDYLKREKQEIIEMIISGKSGPITVNKVNYNRAMPPSKLNDLEIAEVLNYIYERWENQGTKFTEEGVKQVRLQLTGGTKK
jgi:mono/diheme cytochrome c family protein